MQDFLAGHGALVALAILGAMFVAFLSERTAPAGVAIIGAGAFLALGFLTEEQALAAFSNSAPISIGAMFILAAALERTGVLELLANQILSIADVSPLSAIALVSLVVIVSSAFVNNTAVVMILVPVTIELAQRLSSSRQRLLIPLSYLSILGGTCTLIGTSTNLIVSGVSSSRGLERFGIFDITPIGLATLGSGLVFLLLFGRFLLPRGEKDDEAVDRPLMFLTDVFPKEDSDVIGQPPEDVAELKRKGVRLISQRRGNRLIAADAEDRAIAVGDRITLRTTLAELLSLIRDDKFRVGLRLRQDGSEKRIQAQATVTSTDPNIGQPLAKMSYLSTYPITVRGFARLANPAGPTLSSCRIRGGDRILLEGTEDALRALSASTPLIVERELDAVPYRRGHAPFAILILAGVIFASAVMAVPLAVAALVGVGLVLVTGCIPVNEAWKALNAGVLGLIVAMLIVGRGLEEAGAVELILSAAAPWLETASPLILLLLIYALTSLLTELVTNAAVAVILTPIVIGLAAQIGMDPRALVLAVMFGASASFASPIGYQTNTIVYSAGNYRFSDFVKVGLPMNIVAGLASSLTIWWLYI